MSIICRLNFHRQQSTANTAKNSPPRKYPLYSTCLWIERARLKSRWRCLITQNQASTAHIFTPCLFTIWSAAWCSQFVSKLPVDIKQFSKTRKVLTIVRVNECDEGINYIHCTIFSSVLAGSQPACLIDNVKLNLELEQLSKVNCKKCKTSQKVPYRAVLLCLL